MLALLTRSPVQKELDESLKQYFHRPWRARAAGSIGRSESYDASALQAIKGLRGLEGDIRLRLPATTGGIINVDGGKSIG